ncbi:hypothetical protein WJX77_012155 [Trebouxia sp. C0004]
MLRQVLEPTSIVINSKKGLLDAQTCKTKRRIVGIQQDTLHDITAGSKAHPLHISGAYVADTLDRFGRHGQDGSDIRSPVTYAANLHLDIGSSADMFCAQKKIESVFDRFRLIIVPDRVQSKL